MPPRCTTGVPPGHQAAALAWMTATFALLAAVLLASCSGPELTVAARPLLAEADRQFILQASASCMYQERAARLAEQRAIDPMVRSYAAVLVKHHDAMNDELRALALARDLPLPEAPPAERREVLAALNTLAPEMFDARFVQQVGVADHQTDILLFEQASRTLEDAELRAWAAKTLPMLQSHLATAQQLKLPARTLARGLLARPSTV